MQNFISGWREHTITTRISHMLSSQGPRVMAAVGTSSVTPVSTAQGATATRTLPSLPFPPSPLPTTPREAPRTGCTCCRREVQDDTPETIAGPPTRDSCSTYSLRTLIFSLQRAQGGSFPPTLLPMALTSTRPAVLGRPLRSRNNQNTLTFGDQHHLMLSIPHQPPPLFPIVQACQLLGSSGPPLVAQCLATSSPPSQQRLLSTHTTHH